MSSYCINSCSAFVVLPLSAVNCLPISMGYSVNIIFPMSSSSFWCLLTVLYLYYTGPLSTQYYLLSSCFYSRCVIIYIFVLILLLQSLSAILPFTLFERCLLNSSVSLCQKWPYKSYIISLICTIALLQ